MILAAGRGERMRPLSDAVPKPLLVVGGKPLIAWHLESLARAGIARVVVNTSWHAERLQAALGDGTRFGIEIVCSYEGPQPLDTGGGIRNALAQLADPFLVVNGDVFCDLDLARLAVGARDSAQLLLVDNPPHRPDGDFTLRDGRVRETEPSAAGQRLTYAGIGVLRHALFEARAPGRFPLAPLLVAAARADRVGGLRHAGLWSDVGTPERLAALERELATRSG